MNDLEQTKPEYRGSLRRKRAADFLRRFSRLRDRRKMQYGTVDTPSRNGAIRRAVEDITLRRSGNLIATWTEGGNSGVAAAFIGGKVVRGGAGMEESFGDVVREWHNQKGCEGA